MTDKIPKISVVMITYNHEAFIQEAIFSILQQEGHLELELIIADDNSPDATELIVENIKKTHLRGNCIRYFKHKKNIGFDKNFKFALKQATGNFIALCEGDDYWIDSLKLQKQLNWLNEDKNHVFCATKSYKLTNGAQLEQDKYSNLENPWVLTIENFLNPYVIDTNTVVFKNKYDFSAIRSKGFKDLVCFAVILNGGSGILLNNYTGVYRIHEKSVWSTKSELEKSLQNCKTARLLSELFPNGIFESFARDTFEHTIKQLLQSKHHRYELLALTPSYFRFIHQATFYLKFSRLLQILKYLLLGRLSL